MRYARIMGVGKAVLCSHRPSSIVGGEVDHVVGPLHILLAKKEGEDLVWCKISKTLSI
jgi:hypothetical protein